MSYQLLPNIIFIAAVLGIVLIILRHLPEAVQQQQHEDAAVVVEKLSQKGLPAEALSKLKFQSRLWGKRLWNFMLEAKELRPTAVAGYKIKKIFGRQAASVQQQVPEPVVVAAPEIRNEQYYLNEIKNNPKNLGLYNELGRFYIEHGNLQDARDIYQYLTHHDPTNSEYYSRLGNIFYKLKDYAKAVESYDKSLRLDSTQPNRMYNKAICLEALGKYEEAVRTFKSAIHIESQNPKYFISIANVYVKLGNRNEAKVALRNAKKLDPENPDIAQRLKNL